MIPVKEKKEIVNRIQVNSERIVSFGVNRIGLFGSFVKGKQTVESDIDLLVEFDPKRKNFDNYFGLYEFLESVMGKKIEIVTPQSISPYLSHYILGETEYVAL